DLNTTRELYGWTAKTEIYQDANFFVKKGAELKTVAEEASHLGIDWRNYQLAPSTQYLAGITGAVDGVRSIMNGAKIATFVLAIALLSLMLFLWLGERKKETGVLLSVGTTKGGMLRQYWMELGLIAIPAIGISYLVSTFIAQSIGSSVLGSVNSSAKNGFAPGQQAGADLESSSALKTLDSLHVSLGNQDVAYVAIAAAVVIIVCVLLAALPMLRTAPKKLLVALK
ncbi:MAG: ABC transporter permease, partial [Dermabacter sp.]|nr:ABC transporter permease [Dermabacter sp.]